MLDVTDIILYVVLDSYNYGQLHFMSTLVNEGQLNYQWADFYPRIGGIWKEFYYLEGPVYKNDLTIHLSDDPPVASVIGLTNDQQQVIELRELQAFGYSKLNQYIDQPVSVIYDEPLELTYIWHSLQSYSFEWLDRTLQTHSVPYT